MGEVHKAKEVGGAQETADREKSGRAGGKKMIRVTANGADWGRH